jgi:hypothetical protein
MKTESLKFKKMRSGFARIALVLLSLLLIAYLLAEPFSWDANSPAIFDDAYFRYATFAIGGIIFGIGARVARNVVLRRT